MFLRLTAGLACCFLLLASKPAASQQSSLGLSFTSGVTGDGLEYPFSIGPSTPVESGLRPGQFNIFSLPDSQVTISQQGANLAFFDANNLLTRASSRITNEAFWTDPRLFSNNEFNSSNFGISFLNSQPQTVNTVGFDLAVASVAAPLPDSLPLSIQFDSSDPGLDFLMEPLFFVDRIAFGGSSQIVADSSEFQTLNSPFGGRDARVELDLESLFLQANANGPGGPGGDADFSTFTGSIFITIDTRAVDNNNGISVNQVAIDNLSINNAEIPGDTRAEPEIINAPTPNGPANPVTFRLNGPPNANAVNIPASTQNGPIGFSVASGSFVNPGDFRATLYTSGDADVSGLGEATFGFGQTIPVASLSISPPSSDEPGVEVESLTEEIILGLTADETQAGLSPLVFETEALIDAELAEILQGIFLSAEDLTESLTVGDALALGLPIFTGESIALSESALYLSGVSANDYLSLLSADPTNLIVGTQGAAFTPSFDNFGELTGGRVSSFLVTDSSGSFTPTVRVSAVPEPASLVLLSVIGIAFSAQRRRKA